MSFQDGCMTSKEDERREEFRSIDHWHIDTEIDEELRRKEKKLKVMKKRLKKSQHISKKDRKKYKRLKVDYKKLLLKQREAEFEARMRVQEAEIRHREQLAQARMETWLYRAWFQIQYDGKANVGEGKTLLSLPEILKGGDLNEQ